MSVEVNLETYEITVVVDYTEKGDKGKSAYQYAVEQGFVGTEIEWIESLKQPAIDAAIAANVAAENANEKAQLADQSAQGAIEATQLANDATDSAISATNDTVSATNNANVATNNAITATNEANSAKDATIQAISDAQNATQLANQSATNANNKAGLADTAAINANAKATLAQTATDNANIATQEANTAATNANNAAGLALAQRAYVNFLFGITQNETDAVMEYARVNGYKKPGSLYIAKLDNHIRDLKTAGLFAKLDLAYWMVGDGDMNFKTINIINPSKFKGTIIGGLVNTLQGIEGNRLDGYIDTNFNATIGVNKYTLNNATRGAFVYKDGTISVLARWIDGTRVNSYNYFRPANIVATINSTNSATTPADFMNGTGFKLIRRNINNKIMVVNNSLNVEADSLSSALVNTNQLILGYGATLQYSDLGLSSYFLGGSLTFEESQLYRQAILNNL